MKKYVNFVVSTVTPDGIALLSAKPSVGITVTKLGSQIC